MKALRRDGLQLLKERKECLDPSSHPGCRGAALAYSSYAAAMDLESCLAFQSWQEVLMGIVDAGFGLAPLFGEPGCVKAISPCCQEVVLQLLGSGSVHLHTFLLLA